MSFIDRMRRLERLRETVERAKAYQRDDRPLRSRAAVVRDACSTMLYEPTDDEFEEMVRLVDRR